MHELWVEKYRPDNTQDYVWRDPVMKEKVAEWIAAGSLPHLLLSGKSGLGKSSLAFLMLKLLRVPKSDILEINASKERKIDELQDKIVGFLSTYPEWDNEHQIKYVLLEEADSMSIAAQKFLRHELERNVRHVRFVFTCNYREKIEPAIIGRCQEYHFTALDYEEFVQRLLNILDAEKVQYDIEILSDYVENAYPDLRKCIGMLEHGTVGGVLRSRNASEGKTFDYLLDVRDLFNSGKHKQAREMIVSQTNVEQYPEVFRFMYQNLDLWGEDSDTQDRALLVIRDIVYRHAIVCDPEINLSAGIVELTRLNKS
jgi:DNA polymerase III delta prime subunit